jgi:hypothetical protein
VRLCIFCYGRTTNIVNDDDDDDVEEDYSVVYKETKFYRGVWLVLVMYAAIAAIKNLVRSEPVIEHRNTETDPIEHNLPCSSGLENNLTRHFRTSEGALYRVLNSSTTVKPERRNKIGDLFTTTNTKDGINDVICRVIVSIYHKSNKSSIAVGTVLSCTY